VCPDSGGLTVTRRSAVPDLAESVRHELFAYIASSSSRRSARLSW
jgi:hypothetical protein